MRLISGGSAIILLETVRGLFSCIPPEKYIKTTLNSSIFWGQCAIFRISGNDLHPYFLSFLLLFLPTMSLGS